jgi:hypothetical protein
MKCLNCYSEYHPTLQSPICPNCGFVTTVEILPAFIMRNDNSRNKESNSLRKLGLAIQESILKY